MLLAPVPLPLVRERPPLIATRLESPKDSPFGESHWQPIETPEGIVWTAREGDEAATFSSAGSIRFRLPGSAGPYTRLLRRWWSYPLLRTSGGSALIDATTGAMRTSPGLLFGLEDSSVDENGVPVGVRLEGGTPSERRFEIDHGGTSLRIPMGFAITRELYPQLMAAPSGTRIAGVLAVASTRSSSTKSFSTRAFRWSRDDGVPEPLPMPTGADRVTLGALDSRGDVAGTVEGNGVPPRFLIWHTEGVSGTIPLAPVETDPRTKSALDRNPWLAEGVLILTDDHRAIVTQRRKGAGVATCYWDGKRTIWLKDAIEGIRPEGFEDVRRSIDGRSFLIEIRIGGILNWYRVSSR